MHQGSVDLETGNVPLRLDGGYCVHFEGREEDGRALIRLARGTSGPLRAFDHVDDLHLYIDAALPHMWERVSRDEVAEWLDLRLAEFAPA